MLNLGPFYKTFSVLILNQENATNYFCIISLILVSIMICMIFFAEKIKYSDKIFIICAIITILIFRSLSLYSDSQNPDEGQHLANAISISHNPRLWVSTDTTTFGPMCSLSILFIRFVINIFLLPIGKSIGITYFLLRLLNIIILSVSFVFLNKIFEKRLNKRIAWAISLFYVLFFSFNWDTNFQAFNSEYIYIIFITLSMYYLYKFMDNCKIIPLWISGFFCGIMPLVKLQTIPICMIVILWGLYLLLSKDNIKLFKKNINKKVSLIWYLGCVALPTFLLFFYLLLYKDGITNAYFYYIANANAHIGKFTIGQYIIHFFTKILPWLIEQKWYSTIFIIPCIAFLIIYNFRIFRISINSNWVFSCLLFLFGLLAVNHPMRLFPHYMLFLVIPAFIFIMETVVIISQSEYRKIEFLYSKINFHRNFINKNNVLIFIIIFVSLISFKSFPHNILTESILSSKGIVGSTMPYLSPVSQYIKNNTDVEDNIVVWGWEQRVFVFSNRKSATAQTDIQRLYYPYPKKNIEMYIADIHKNKPKFIIDIVAPRSFAYQDENDYSLEKHNQVWQAICDDYSLLFKIPVSGGSYKIYSNVKLNEIYKNLTQISKITIPLNISEISSNDINSIYLNNSNLVLECGSYDPHIIFKLNEPISLHNITFCNIKIKCSNNISGDLQIFYDFGDGFNEMNSFNAKIDILSEIDEIHYPIFDWKGRTNLLSFRIDPPNDSIFEIESIELIIK